MKKVKRVSRLIQMLAVASLGLSLVACSGSNSKELEDLKNQLEQMQETSKNKDEQIKDLNDKLQAEKDKNATLSSSILGYQTAQAEWETARANLLSTIEDLNAQIKELENGGVNDAELQAKLDKALADLQEAQNKADEYKTQLGNLPTENAELKNQVARLELNVEGYKNTIESLNQQVTILNNKLKESEESKKQLSADYLNVVDLYNKLYLQSEELNSTITSLNTTINELTAENESLKAEIESLKNQSTSDEEYSLE